MSRLFTQLRLRVRSLFRRRIVERELDEELQYHLDRETEESLAKGLAPESAHYSALRAMGAITQHKEECRDMRALEWIGDLMQDLRHGVRTLRKNIAFSVVAVLALALGIGANTAMFTVAYGLLLRPLPYAGANRLAAISMTYGQRDAAFDTMCVRDYLTWKENNRSFEEPALLRTQRMDIGGGGIPEQVRGASVTAGLFPILGVPPLIGRTFAAGEDKPGTGSLTVLSESIWRRRFGASSSVLGQTVLLNGSSSTVIGVMPGVFQFPPQVEVWTNLLLIPPTRYGPWVYRGLARLKPGVTFEQAQDEMNSIALRMVQQNPQYKRVTLPVLNLRDAILGSSLKPAIWVLAGAVGMVLLIAVVNVANLMLARATVREREMTLRLSLGASRGRLVRQLLTESMLLAAAGGLVGLGLAWGGVELIRVSNPGYLPLIDSIHLDWSAFSFVALVSVLTSLLFGLAPAVAGARANLNLTIKDGGRSGSPSRTRGRARAVLVIAEIALSLILLVGAGLLLRSFLNLQRVTGGFSAPPHKILTILISPVERKYNDPRAGRAFYDEVLRRASGTPGVELAAITDSLPPDRLRNADTFQISGQILAPGDMNPVVSTVTANSGFFQALRVPLVSGRRFTDRDDQGSAPVAIVSEGFARRFFPAQQAVGKRIRQGGGPWMEIVGVVGNVKYLGLTVDSDPAYYMPFSQAYSSRMFLVIRSLGDAANLADTLRREIQSIDSGVTLAQIGTMEEALDRSVSRPRFNTLLLVLFAAIALVLAAIGIYGLIAYWVVQRTHEIGVRMALGAAPNEVMLMVIRQGASLAAVGIVIGLGGAFALTRLLGTMLFGVSGTDALTFVFAPAGIMLVVLVATLVPAFRATQTSPVVALRYD